VFIPFRLVTFVLLTDYTNYVRVFSLFFVFITLVLLAQFLIYVIRGPVEPMIAGFIFISFLVCLAPALYLLKPFESRESLRRRREEARRKREERWEPMRNGPPRDSGS
jgi:hypothetical protein